MGASSPPPEAQLGSRRPVKRPIGPMNGSCRTPQRSRACVRAPRHAAAARGPLQEVQPSSRSKVLPCAHEGCFAPLQAKSNSETLRGALDQRRTRAPPSYLHAARPDRGDASSDHVLDGGTTSRKRAGWAHPGPRPAAQSGRRSRFEPTARRTRRASRGSADPHSTPWSPPSRRMDVTTDFTRRPTPSRR